MVLYGPLMTQGRFKIHAIRVRPRDLALEALSAASRADGRFAPTDHAEALH